MEKKGSFEYTETLIEKYYQKAKQEIEKLGGHETLSNLVERLRKLDK
jgi:hypothetical protein